MGKIENPNENLPVPKWITVDYFKKVLANDGEIYEKIKNFTPIAATSSGENYTSIMLRIHLDLELKDGSNKHKTYIMKAMLDDEKGGFIVNKMQLFPKELQMYETILPAFEELYQAAGKPVKFAPRCLLTETKDNRISFVFEDLSPGGYVTGQRLKGLNMDEMQRSLQMLAEFHAASMVYFEQNGPYPENFNYNFIRETSYEGHRKPFEMKAREYKAALKTWGSQDIDKYLEKFPTFDQYWKSAMRMLDTSRNSFNVLNHADFWTNNIMFKYLPDGKVDDISMIDFQICKWGNPADDLLYLITISAASNIRFKHFEKFVVIYYDRLIECLELLKYKRPLPKLRDLQMDLCSESANLFVFYAIFNQMPLILFPSDKDSNIGLLVSSKEEGIQFRLRMYENPLFKEAMLDIIPFFSNRGLLNFSDYDNYQSCL